MREEEREIEGEREREVLSTALCVFSFSLGLAVHDTELTCRNSSSCGTMYKMILITTLYPPPKPTGVPSYQLLLSLIYCIINNIIHHYSATIISPNKHNSNFTACVCETLLSKFRTLEQGWIWSGKYPWTLRP